MRSKTSIILLSLVFGLVVWLLDTYIDTQFFGEGNFWEHLLFAAPAEEVYDNLVQVAFFLIFGVIFAFSMERLNKTERELRKQRDRLAGANEELKAFAHTLAHDLRAPMRHINGYSGMLLDEAEGQISDESRKHLMLIQSAVLRMDALIDDILKLSRASMDNLSIQSTDLSSIAREIAENFRRQEPQRSVEFVIADHASARCDTGLMRVAIENLLNNAWKYTIKQPNPRIEFGFEANGGNPTYFVRDNGIGFKPEDTGKLFKVFSRLHPRSEYEGTGIGLATVKRIIERHGGRVWAEGAIDNGATFYFTLG